MNQRTHTWIAMRALALLEDEKECPRLVKLLKPYVKTAAIGSWIPDLADSKKGSGDIDNHVLKMKPYSGLGKERFVVNKKELLKQLGNERLMSKFLKNDTSLKDDWWNKPYKAEPSPGQHLANRTMALSVTITDLLILGDRDVAKLVPRTVRFSENLDSDARSHASQVATYFFMMTHFIADSNMTCHCDARKLAAYSSGLHHEMEGDWSKRIGTYFDKKKLFASDDSPNQILKKVKTIDEKFDITFSKTVPPMKARDAWAEIIAISRGSFAVNSILVPPTTHPYSSKETTSFKDVFAGEEGKKLLSDINRISIHDAVLNVAIIWKDIWKTFG